MRLPVSVLTFAAALLIPGASLLAEEPSKAPAPKPKSSAKESKMSTHPKMIVETSKGTITIELHPEDAPKTCAGVSALIKKGFYDGLDFHRYEPGFVIQGGDPARKHKEEAPNIPGEFKANGVENKLSHKKGAVGLARTPDPNSGNSQWYICIGDATFLDNNYCAFGMVVDGMDAAEALRAGDVMKKVTLKE